MRWMVPWPQTPQLALNYCLHYLNMTRQKWTTKEQEDWLEERKPAFLLANQQKNAAKTFFPTIIKEFREKWPVMPVTQEEIDNAGTLELAERAKRERYDKVNTRMSCMKERNLTYVDSVPPRGIITIRTICLLTVELKVF